MVPIESILKALGLLRDIYAFLVPSRELKVPFSQLAFFLASSCVPFQKSSGSYGGPPNSLSKERGLHLAT